MLPCRRCAIHIFCGSPILVAKRSLHWALDQTRLGSTPAKVHRELPWTTPSTFTMGITWRTENWISGWLMLWIRGFGMEHKLFASESCKILSTKNPPESRISLDLQYLHIGSFLGVGTQALGRRAGPQQKPQQALNAPRPETDADASRKRTTCDTIRLTVRLTDASWSSRVQRVSNRTRPLSLGPHDLSGMLSRNDHDSKPHNRSVHVACGGSYSKNTKWQHTWDTP